MVQHFGIHAAGGAKGRQGEGRHQEGSGAFVPLSRHWGYRNDSLSIDRMDSTCGLSLSDHRDKSILIAGNVHVPLFVFADATQWRRSGQE